MQASAISHRETGFFSPLVLDYLAGAAALKPFYKYLPGGDFSQVITDTSAQAFNRKALVEALERQYRNVDAPQAARDNIRRLEKDSTFTITTGHQLCIFTGPLYFIYKTIHAINLAEALKAQHPQHDFVPVFWLASEDHGLKEAARVNLFGKTLRWAPEGTTAFGRRDAAGMAPLLKETDALLGKGAHADELRALFGSAYREGHTMAAATRHLLNALFGEHGLVVLDPDDALLKKELAPIALQDITKSISGRLVEQCTKKLAQHYPPQFEPSGSNWFYLTDALRSRIEREGERFSVDKTTVSFSAKELQQEITGHPERFSPNVALRPLYQQVLLPNLAYLGGPGEVAYWLQLKGVFDHYRVNYPVVLLRNSALWLDAAAAGQMKQAGLAVGELFEPPKETPAPPLLSAERQQVQEAFAAIAARAAALDRTLQASAQAALKKQLAALDALEKKLQKVSERQRQDPAAVARRLRQRLFPKGGPQERHDNFIPLYLRHGRGFFAALKEHLPPLGDRVVVLVEEEK